MPIYQISYDNINTDEVKKALCSVLKQEIKDDEFRTPSHPICHAQASVWFIDTPNETVGTDLCFVKFDDKDIMVTKVSCCKNSVKANKQYVKEWLDYHLK